MLKCIHVLIMPEEQSILLFIFKNTLIGVAAGFISYTFINGISDRYLESEQDDEDEQAYIVRHPNNVEYTDL